MKHLKITAALLLLVQLFHLALLQDSTDSPGRTIDKSWLRQKPLNTANSENNVSPAEDTDAPLTTGDNDASGYMTLNTEEENDLYKEKSENETSGDFNNVYTTPNPVFVNGTTKQREQIDSSIPPTTISSNSSQINMTEAKEKLNSTGTTTENSTSFEVFSNNTELHSTTLAPEKNTTEASTAQPYADKGLTNHTGSTNTTSVITTAAYNTSSSTTTLPSETSYMSTVTTTTALLNTPERANKTGKGASGSDQDTAKESESHLYRSKRNVAWVAVLGTAVAMACVGLVAYIILKKKHQKGFTHRKLVEEYPSDPVLRLDNSEPLDLNFGGSAYYNPGLQGDSIQMTNFPGRR